MLRQSIVMIWSGAIYSNGPAMAAALLMRPQKHTEPINDGEKPAGSWAPAAPGGPQLPSLCQMWKFPLSPWHRDCHPLTPPSWGAHGSIPNPFPCAGITESLVLLQGAQQGRSWKAGFPISDGFWNEFACKPLIPELLNCFTLPYGDSFPSCFSQTATTAKDGSVIDSLTRYKTLNKMKNSLDLVEDSEIKPGAKADPEVISELLQWLKMWILHV